MKNITYYNIFVVSSNKNIIITLHVLTEKNSLRFLNNLFFVKISSVSVGSQMLIFKGKYIQIRKYFFASNKGKRMEGKEREEIYFRYTYNYFFRLSTGVLYYTSRAYVRVGATFLK